MKDSVFEGLGRRPAPWTERGEIAVEPGGAGGKVAFSRSHLVDAACEKFGEAHKGGKGEGGHKRVPGGGRGHGRPLTKEDGPGFLFHRHVRVRRRVRRGYGEGRGKVWVEKGKQGAIL